MSIRCSAPGTRTAACGVLALTVACAPASTARPSIVERDGQVEFEAEDATRTTGAWRQVADGDRIVMRMNGPDGGMFEGRHMYLAYEIEFSTPGRYRLHGLMRSAGTKATDDVWVYWNREPGGDSREDFELKVESIDYAWSHTFKDLPLPEPPSKRPKNRDFAERGLPVDAPGRYTLFIAKGEEPFGPEHTIGTDADFYAFDRFALRLVEPEPASR